MKNYFGKQIIILIFALFWLTAGNCSTGNCSTGSCSIRLSVTDTNNIPIKEIGIEKNIYITLTIDQPHSQPINIAGMENIKTTGQRKTIRDINGTITTAYTSIASIEKAGEYTIGPATTTIDGKPVTSHRYTFSVIAKEKEGVTPLKNAPSAIDKNNKIYTLFSLDNTAVFVGQKIVATLQFLYPSSLEDKIIFKKAVFPDFGNHITTTQKHGPVLRKKKIKNGWYTALEWQWNLYPNRPGAYILPKSTIFYKKKDENEHHFSFFSFISTDSLIKKESNTLSYYVSPLPKYEKPVNAVGTFCTYDAHFEPEIITQGEGATLHIIIEGNLNFHAINPPTINGLAKEMRCYQGKSNICYQCESGFDQKHFQYVIHCLSPGTFLLPAQTFTYFDLKQNCYIKKETKPLSITVKPREKNNSHSSLEDRYIQAENPLEEKQQSFVYSIKPIVTQYPPQKPPERSISWQWFLLLLLCPYIIFIFYLLIQMYAHTITTYITLSWKKQRAYADAQKKIAAAIKQNEIVSLYALIIALIKARRCMQKKNISCKEIASILKQSGMSDAHIVQWNSFFKTIQAAAFSKTDVSKDEKKALLIATTAWIKKIKKVL